MAATDDRIFTKPGRAEWWTRAVLLAGGIVLIGVALALKRGN